jgi:hypothetical protein
VINDETFQFLAPPGTLKYRMRLGTLELRGRIIADFRQNDRSIQGTRFARPAVATSMRQRLAAQAHRGRR